MAETIAKPKDVPICIQQTFIIYSSMPRDGQTLILPGTPKIRQAADFSCVTGFESATGSFSNGVIEITPEVSASGALSFTVIGKEQGATGSASFSLTLKTKGNDSLESCVKTFTIRVIILGRSDLFSADRVRTLYVGDRVETQSILPPLLNPTIDFGAPTGPIMDNSGKYSSGISVSLETDATGRVVDVKMSGTAARPGVYCVWVTANQYDEGGKYDFLPQTFQAGNGTVPLILQIIDCDYADGLLMLAEPAVLEAASVYRVVWASEMVFSFPSAEHLINCEMAPQSDGSFLGSYSEKKTAGDGTPYTLLYEYRLRANGTFWKLEGREKDSRESGEKTWDEYDQSAFRIPGQTLPHVWNWPEVILQAPSRFMLHRRPAESPEANWENCGFFHEIAPDIYEQQLQYTPQFPGLIMPLERRFNSGWILGGESHQFDGYEIKKIPFSEIVTPFAPPQSEFYGEDLTREITALAPDCPLGLSGQVQDGISVIPGNRWRYWPGIRRVVPANGTELHPVQRTFSITYHLKDESASEYISEYVNNGLSGIIGKSESSRETISEVSYSGSIDMDGQTRDGAELRMLIGASYSGSGSSTKSDIYTENINEHHMTDPSYEWVSSTVNEETYNGSGDNFHGFGAYYFGSGPCETPFSHDAVATAAASFSGSGVATGFRRETINGETTETELEARDFSASGSFFSDELKVFSSDVIPSLSYDYGEQSRTVSGKLSWGYEGFDPEYIKNGGWSYYITWSAQDRNGRKTGETYYEKIENGEVVETGTLEDPDGSQFGILLDRLARGDDVPEADDYTGKPENLMFNMDSDWSESRHEKTVSFS